MTKITNEINSIIPNIYPTLYNSLGYNTNDAGLLAIEAGIYKWCQDLCTQWESVPCPCVGIITTQIGRAHV